MEIADLERVQKIIGDLEKKYNDGSFIFRGATKEYSADPDGDGVNSALYRWAVKELGGKHVFDSKRLTLAHLEREHIEKVKRLLSQNTDKRELLTSLQHYGGKTSLIDFTRSLHVALFFACNDYLDKDEDVKDGELIVMRADILPNSDEIEHPGHEQIAPTIQIYTPSVSKESVTLIEPAKTDYNKQRVLTQHSVFVRAVSGYLKKDTTAEGSNIAKGKYAVEKIAKKDKEVIMTYLANYYDVNFETIYNDLAGFIANTSNYESFEFCVQMGESFKKTYHYEKSLVYYRKALIFDSQSIHASTVYYAIGLILDKLKRYEEAETSFTDAIKINPNYYQAYFERGRTRVGMDNYPDGIADYDIAFDLTRKNRDNSSDLGMILIHRGLAKEAMGNKEGAKTDFEEAKKYGWDYQHSL